MTLYTNFDIFNTKIRGKKLVKKPNMLQPHMLVQKGEETTDSALNYHTELVGFVDQNTSGHPHRENYHSSTPLNIVLNDGSERPSSDIYFEDNGITIPVDKIYWETNTQLMNSHFAVYPDGTPMVALHSDAEIQNVKRKQQSQNIYDRLVQMIQRTIPNGTSKQQLETIDFIQEGVKYLPTELQIQLQNVLTTYQQVPRQKEEMFNKPDGEEEEMFNTLESTQMKKPELQKKAKELGISIYKGGKQKKKKELEKEIMDKNK